MTTVPRSPLYFLWVSTNPIEHLNGAGVMKFVASRGLSDRYRRAVEGHSPWKRDTKNPQPISVSHVERSDLAEALKATIIGEGIGTLAFVPMEAG